MRQAGDQYPIAWWNAASWVLLGLAPTLIAGWDDPGGRRYWSPVLAAVLALAYAAAFRFPSARPPFLLLLIAGLAGVSYLRGGNAALYVVALPHFWLYAQGTRQAIGLSGAAAAATVLGALLATGDLLSGDNLITLLAYPASVLLALSMHQIIRRSEDRARRLATELEAAQRELAQAHRRQGAASERERLAREIHDTLAQGFASIVVLAEAARSAIAADPDRSAQQLMSIENTARDNLTEARVLVGTAPQDHITPGTLTTTLRRTLDRFAQDTGLRVDADLADLADLNCSQQTRIALLRLTQETLANVRKHAAASTVTVVLARHPHGIELEVTDDGRGFMVATSRGFGLQGMRRRLAELGGELTITSSAGEGTRVLATIPQDGAP